MNFRTLVFLSLALVIFCGNVQAATKYVAQVATGAGDGSSTGNRMSIAAVNASWPVLPGGTLSLGGTITNQLIVGGSGTSAAWEKILFESGANMTQTNWGGYASGGAAISINAKYYIEIDGGANGLIQATGTGTGIYTNDDVGIGGSAYFCTIHNLTITNMYKKVKGVLDDTRVGYPINLAGSSITYSNNVVSDGDCGLTYSPGDAIQSNYMVLGNTILNCNHSTQIGMGNSNCYLTNVIYANNYFDHWDVWDCPGNTQIHLDGIWIWNNTYDPSSFITGVQIYDNNFGGFVGTRTTGAIASYLYNAPYQCQNAFIYNNTFQCFYPGSWGGGFIAWGNGSNTFILNNTIIGTLTNGTLYGGRIVLGCSPAYCYNNLCYYASGIQTISGSSNSVATGNDGSNTALLLGTYFTNTWSDYNIFYDQGNGLAQFSCEYDQAPVGVSWVSGGLYPLSVWQTWYNNNRGMPLPIWNTAHADPHSTTNQVTFFGSTFQPAASDTTARLAGTNLTSVANAFNVPGLLKDANGVLHPTTGPWTIGAQEAASSGPVAPAFTQQPANVSGLTNTTLAFSWTASGDSSTTYFEVMMTNSGSVIYPFASVTSWNSNSPVAQSNWIWIVATNDTQVMVTSSPVLMQWTNGVSVTALPTFTSQPSSQVNRTNNTLFYMWGVSGNGDPSAIFAQLQYTNTGIAASPWSINFYFGTNSPVIQSNWVDVVITNDFGSATSGPVLMQWTNGVPPTITLQPQTSVGLTNAPGITVMFTAGASGYTSLQWYQTNGSTAPSTALTLTTSSAVAQTNGFFMVAANASGSVTSLTAIFVTTNSTGLPVITSNPQTVQNVTNSTFTLTATATGTGPITLQWFNTNGWAAAPSITSAFTTNVTVAGTNWYALVAQNGGGSATSSVAGILVSNGIAVIPPQAFLMRIKAH